MKKIVIILIILFSLTGCIKNNVDMKLETNNSFNITVINAVQSTGSDYSFKDEDIQKYKDNGYLVEDYNENGYIGIKLFFEVDDINKVSGDNIGTVELTELLNTKTSDVKLFKKEKVEDGYLYSANFSYDLNTTDLDGESESISGDIDISNYADMMDLNYSITLPVKLESSNATSENGNTYTWKLEYGKVNEIRYSFIIKNKDITKEKIEYQKETKKNDDNSIQNLNNISSKDVAGFIFGGGIIVLIVFLYFFVRRKISKGLSRRKRNKYKNNNFHLTAPESIKEKK